MAVGMAMAQQIMQQSGVPGATTPGAPAVAGAAAPAAAPQLFSAAEVAQQLGVGESDVLQILESGELKGKKIGTTWRVPKAAVDTYLSA
jgi:excisionase family DNA binding protein